MIRRIEVAGVFTFNSFLKKHSNKVINHLNFKYELQVPHAFRWFISKLFCIFESGTDTCDHTKTADAPYGLECAGDWNNSVFQDNSPSSKVQNKIQCLIGLSIFEFQWFSIRFFSICFFLTQHCTPQYTSREECEQSDCNSYSTFYISFSKRFINSFLCQNDLLYLWFVL